MQLEVRKHPSSIRSTNERSAVKLKFRSSQLGTLLSKPCNLCLELITVSYNPFQMFTSFSLFVVYMLVLAMLFMYPCSTQNKKKQT